MLLRKYYNILVFISLCFIASSYAQNRATDSLLAIIKVISTDTATVNTLNALSLEYRNQNPDTALHFAKKALRIATKLNYQFGIADAQLKIGNALMNIGENEKALFSLNTSSIHFDKLLASNIAAEKRQLIRSKAQTLNSIGLLFNSTGQYNKALSNLFAALKLRQSMHDKKGISYSYHNIGYVYQNLANYSEALKYAFEALKIKQALKDEKTIASTYTLIASIYEKQGKYAEALKLHFQSLKLSEKINDKIEIYRCYHNIGVIYESQKNYDEALKNFQLSLQLKLELGDETQLASAYEAIGNVYCMSKNYDKAFEYYQIAIQYAQKVNDKSEIISIYCNIAANYYDQNKIKEALKLSLNALKLAKEIGDREAEAMAMNVISDCYFRLNDLGKANFYASQNLSLAKEIGSLANYYDCYTLLAQLESAKGNYKQALEHYKLAIIYRDSTENKENTKKIVEAQMNYEFEKKQTADSIKVSADKKVLHAQVAQQKTQRNGFIVGFTLVLLLAGFIFRNYKQKQKANLLLEEKNIAITSQKEVIEKQKKIVDVKQKQIVDSINYAKRIQKSILIPEQSIQQHLPNSFVLFIPRDIVSGDFYWFHQHENQSIVVCADCTGHGVPGAFLSMVGSTLLNEIVIQKQITDPANIMKLLAAGVSDTLKHKEKDEMDTDGMDISICTFQNKEVHFAAANNPVYVVNQNGLMEIEPQVNSINGIFEMNTDEKIESIRLSPEAGSMVYLSTDGFADQPGQKTNKKLYAAGFEKLLTQIHQLPLIEQKEKLAAFFIEWKGNLKQHDDILVMGIRV
jgi:tetratricopeptide (TPR) repeat protein